MYHLKINQSAWWRLCHSVQGLRTWKVHGKGRGSPAMLLLAIYPRDLIPCMWHGEHTRLFTVALFVVAGNIDNSHYVRQQDPGWGAMILPYSGYFCHLKKYEQALYDWGGKIPKTYCEVKTARFKTRYDSYHLLRKEGEKKIHDYIYISGEYIRLKHQWFLERWTG